MSTKPESKSTPASSVKVVTGDRYRALQNYKRAHHPAYDEWCSSRIEAATLFQREAKLKFPAIGQIGALMNEADTRLRDWDRANPSPLTREEAVRLEEEFEAQLVRPDLS
jgi:hypothetical protein